MERQQGTGRAPESPCRWRSHRPCDVRSSAKETASDSHPYSPPTLWHDGWRVTKNPKVKWRSDRYPLEIMVVNKRDQPLWVRQIKSNWGTHPDIHCTSWYGIFREQCSSLHSITLPSDPPNIVTPQNASTYLDILSPVCNSRCKYVSLGKLSLGTFRSATLDHDCFLGFAAASFWIAQSKIERATVDFPSLANETVLLQTTQGNEGIGRICFASLSQFWPWFLSWNDVLFFKCCYRGMSM